jgi:hypothetical protein
MWRLSAAFNVDRQFRSFRHPQFDLLIVARFGAAAIGVYKLAYLNGIV